MELEKNVGNDIYVDAEAKANLYNLNFLLVLILMAVFSVLLNFLGFFKIDGTLMIIIMTHAAFFFIAPVITWVFHDIILKKPTQILRWKNFKHIIITCSYVGMMLVCISLSFHVIIMLIVPMLMVCQYRYDKKLTSVIMIATILLVPISVYGSFFFGVPDRNMIKGMLTDEEAKLLVNRIKIATTRRMIDLLTHYVFPRAMGALAVEFLLFGNAKRNQRMLDGQKELADVAQHEMERRNDLQRHVIDDLAGVIETRDVGTGEHVIRTKKYIDIIARELQKHDEYKNLLTEDVIQNIEAAAPLHDVGKIAISDTILLKPGKLTPEEFDIMKQHAQKGGEMIENIFANLDDKEFLDKAYNIAMFHHEKWDGSGYPQHRSGEDIPLEARLMAIADVYDALVSRRIYKEPMPPKDAFKVILEGAGTHFDPKIIEIISPLEDTFVKASQESIETDKK